MTFPTYLTILRIVLAIIFSVFASLPDVSFARPVALVIFIVAALTDKIDGHLARKNKQVTTLGAFLDPIADKMLVSLAFLILVYQNIVPLWVFAVILIRDLAVDGLRMLASSQKKVIAASFAGKFKTTLQMIALIIIQFGLVFPSDFIRITGNIFLYAALLLTIYSTIEYFYKNRKILTK